MNIGELVTVKTIEDKDSFNEKHTPYSAEIRLFSCVAQGDIDSLLSCLKNLRSIIVMGKMSEDELTQYKYMAVSTVTLATRYAIQGGLPENKAYDFSDRVIKAADSLGDKNEILMLLGTEIVKLTSEVKKHRKEPRYSPHIRSSIKYINENITEKLTVSLVASRLGISSDYLSQIFKREMGEKLSTYIVRQKLQTAKKLLLEGKTSKEIALTLGFSSQAYFVTLFRRFYNMTPSEYLKLVKTEN